MAKSKDLFDESTMTFGEHLEVLRAHLVKSVLGLVVVMCFTLYFGDRIVVFIRKPIDRALERNQIFNAEEVSSYWAQFSSWIPKFSSKGAEAAAKPPVEEKKPEPPTNPSTILVQVKPSELLRVLHGADPARYPEPKSMEGEKPVALPISAPEFLGIRNTIEQSHRPVTLNVQEAFMVYIKVALIAGLIIASPWIFYQMWLFVAAGLYPHERRYVYVYLPMSLALFLGGALFCWLMAIPPILDFLLSYNRYLGVVPTLRLSEWVTFVILLPLMFGLSFQLPLIMLFLERINIFGADDYRSRRRLAIFVMAVASMLLSPSADIGTMMMMFIPLTILYEFGILLCVHFKARQPFEEPAVS